MFRFSIFVLSIMIKSQYLKFYNHFGKFREPPVEGLLLKNYGKGGGASGSLPFFVGCFSSSGGYSECGNLFLNKSRIYKE
jgi:hypothetical protein